MSADNGIYVTQWNDGFRVCHAQAIENLDYFRESSEFWRAEQVLLFGNSPVFKTREEALKKAGEMELEILADEYCPILEYGISTIPGNRGDFPQMEREDAQDTLRKYWELEEYQKGQYVA